MRDVHVVIRVPASDPAAVFEALAAFGRYPDIAESVRSVSVEDLGGGRSRSEWEVDFREGILTWTEDDVIDAGAGTITFTQIDGDFEQFEGVWSVRPDGDGSVVDFRATLDVGIPSLGLVIEPIAERSLQSNIMTILQSLFGDAVEVDAS